MAPSGRHQQPTGIRKALLQLARSTLIKEAVAEVKVGKTTKNCNAQGTQPAKRVRITQENDDEGSGEYKPASMASAKSLLPRARRSQRSSSRIQRIQTQSPKTPAPALWSLELGSAVHVRVEEDEDEVQIISSKGPSLAPSKTSTKETVPTPPGKNIAEPIVVDTEVGEVGEKEASQFHWAFTPATPTIDSDPRSQLVLAAQQALNMKSHKVQTELLMPPPAQRATQPARIPATIPTPAATPYSQAPSLPSFTFSCEHPSPFTDSLTLPPLNEFFQMHISRGAAIHTPIFVDGPLPLPHSLQAEIRHVQALSTRLPSFNELVASIEGASAKGPAS